MSENNGHDPELNKAPSSTLPDKKVRLKSQDMKTAFFKPNSSNPTDQLVVAGDDPRDMAMRTVLGKDIDDGINMARGFAIEMAECEEFEDEDGRDALLFQFSFLPSVMGLARQQLVDSIIGDKQMRYKSRGGGFFDKMKDYAFSGDGEKEK